MQVAVYIEVKGHGGGWVNIPATEQTIIDKLALPAERVIDYLDYEISDYEAPFPVPTDVSFNQLNHLVEKLSEEPIIFANSGLIMDEFSWDMEDLINLMETIRIFDAKDEETLGMALCDEGYYDVPEELNDFIDYEKLGKEWVLANNVLFANDKAFVSIEG